MTPRAEQYDIGLRLMRHVLGQYALAMWGLALFMLLGRETCGVNCSIEDAYLVSAIGLFALSLASIRVIVQLLVRDANMIWMPAVIFPLSTLTFFGFGSMSILFADEFTLYRLMSGNYAIDTIGLMQTLLLTSIGVATTSTFMSIGLRLRSLSFRWDRQVKAGSLFQTAIMFTLIGATLKYGLILPSEMGGLNITVPGALKSLKPMVDLGLAILIYLGVRGNRVASLLFYVLWPLHLGLTTLEFSKKALVIAIIIPAAGAYLAHRDWRRLVPWVVLAALAFTTAQDINTTARFALIEANRQHRPHDKPR